METDVSRSVDPNDVEFSSQVADLLNRGLVVQIRHEVRRELLRTNASGTNSAEELAELIRQVVREEHATQNLFADTDLEERIARISAAINSLSTRVGRAEDRARRLEAIERQVEALKSELSDVALGANLTADHVRQMTDATKPATEDGLESLHNRITALEDHVTDADAGDARTLEGLAARVAALEVGGPTIHGDSAARRWDLRIVCKVLSAIGLGAMAIWFSLESVATYGKASWLLALGALGCAAGMIWHLVPVRGSFENERKFGLHLGPNKLLGESKDVQTRTGIGSTKK